MAKIKCPKCGALINESNGNRCERFPICTYQAIAESSYKKYIMYDLETTGLSRKDSIIEIGAIYVDDNIIKDRFSSLCNPGLYVSQRITEVTGITNSMLENEKSEKEVLKEFIEWCEQKETDLAVGHNINNFDNQMLHAATTKYKYAYPFKRSLDTMVLAKKLKIKDMGSASYKQCDLAEFYGITYTAHRAVNDTEALFEIFQHLKKQTEEFPIINITFK